MSSVVVARDAVSDSSRLTEESLGAVLHCADAAGVCDVSAECDVVEYQRTKVVVNAAVEVIGNLILVHDEHSAGFDP